MIQVCKLSIGNMFHAANMMQGSRSVIGNRGIAVKAHFDMCDRPLSGISRVEGALSGQSAIPLEECRALQERFNKLGVSVSSFTCAVVLQLSRNAVLPHYNKQAYKFIVENARNLEECLDSLLVQICIETKAFNKAHIFVTKLPHLNVLVWNCLIGAYVQQEQMIEALQVFKMMQEKGVFPDKVTFVNALSACNSPLALTEGKCLNYIIVFVGCKIDVVLGTALTTMYSKCGSLEDTQRVFDSMKNCNVVSWTAMIGAYTRNQQFDHAFYLYEQMKQEGTLPNRVTFLGLLETCSCQKMLVNGKQLHTCIIKGVEFDMHLVTALVHMYGKCGSLKDAQDLFQLLNQRDAALWNALIGASVRHKQNNEAIQSFYCMLNEGLIPNPATYATIVSACVHNTLSTGKKMHAHIICNEFDNNIVVATALINMYGKNGSLDNAIFLFDNMKEQNVVTWNTIIAVYAEHQRAEDVLQSLENMQLKGFWANNVTYVNALKAYAGIEALPAGKRLHCCIAESGYDMDVVVATALAGMYCRCGKLRDGYRVFSDMTERNIISWNTMVSACGQHGCGMQGLTIYEQMQWEGVTPDQFTHTSMLSICANQLVLLSLGKYIHSCIMHSGCEPEIIVETSLLDMYGKCGSLQDACKVFDKMSKQSVVPWNVMISNYAQHGYVGEAIGLVNAMQQKGVIPDNVTFVGLLSACSHTGMLVEGFYNSLLMNIYGIKPMAEQFHCIIDLLGRAGQAEEAEDLIHKMPLEPSLIAWMALLGCCRNTTDVEQGEYIAKHVFEYDPGNSAALALLASIHNAN